VGEVVIGPKGDVEGWTVVKWSERGCPPVGTKLYARALLAEARERTPWTLPTNEELERVYENHQGHAADFAADVLERWGGWQRGLLGYGGRLAEARAPGAISDEEKRAMQCARYCIPFFPAKYPRKGYEPPSIAPPIEPQAVASRIDAVDSVQEPKP
jgi:hypothetical protein